MDIPVYLFTGFLEAGKTRFLQETLSDANFFKNGDERTLVLLCEEGEEELDPLGFVSSEVYVEIIPTNWRPSGAVTTPTASSSSTTGCGCSRICFRRCRTAGSSIRR